MRALALQAVLRNMNSACRVPLVVHIVIGMALTLVVTVFLRSMSPMQMRDGTWHLLSTQDGPVECIRWVKQGRRRLGYVLHTINGQPLPARVRGRPVSPGIDVRSRFVLEDALNILAAHESHRIWIDAFGWPAPCIWVRVAPTNLEFLSPISSDEIVHLELSQEQVKFVRLKALTGPSSTVDLGAPTPNGGISGIHVSAIGLMINSLILASMSWIGWLTLNAIRRATTAMRSTIRIRKGRCPACNYWLRGSREPGCPECGWQREIEAHSVARYSE